jgi:diaminopimelate decarboxylase
MDLAAKLRALAPDFAYENGRLATGGVDLAAIADAAGGPVYVYALAGVLARYREFEQAFAGQPTRICYAMKSNDSVGVLKALATAGAGVDVVSGGELALAMATGVPADRIVFSGVGKTEEEMAAALEAGIHQFNVESEPELEALNALAGRYGKQAPIALRVNPDVAAGGHDKISTGRKEDKFGVPWSQARPLYAKAREMKGIAVKGVDLHIGSQISDLAPFEAAFRKAADLIADLRADGCAIERLDLGGGLGIPYGGAGTVPPHPDDYAALIKRVTAPLGVQLIFEPGRMIAGNAGVLVTRVIFDKEGEARRFLIVDAGMNDLIRPALYDAHHDILPVTRDANAPTVTYDVVGPVCESSDFLAKARTLPEVKPGECVAVMSAGAYGAVQASQYNTRPLVPEVLVNGEKYAVIRKRPSFEEIVAIERFPDWLD